MGPREKPATLERVGVELELLAPENKGRRALAERLAAGAGGSVLFGLKYSSPGNGPDGRPVCELTPAYRVLDARKRQLATLVDDPSLTVSEAHADETGDWGGTTDDVRLALLAERLCWSDEDSAEALYEPLAHLFAGSVERAPNRGSWGQVVDDVGHVVVRGHAFDPRRERACEVVLPPMARTGLRRALEPILQVAKRLGFTLPREAALHVHFDAEPFRHTARLKRLIEVWAARRDAWWEVLETNPRCTRLGAPPADVLRVAREADGGLPFSTFAAALLLAGANKSCDLNLLGVLERRPRQPTLEVRCLPMSFSAGEVEEKVELAATLLAQACVAGSK